MDILQIHERLIKLLEASATPKTHHIVEFIRLQALPIVDEYRKLLKTPKRISFFACGDNGDEACDNSIDAGHELLRLRFLQMLNRNQPVLLQHGNGEMLELLGWSAAQLASIAQATGKMSILSPDDGAVTTLGMRSRVESPTAMQCMRCGASQFAVDGNIYTCSSCGLFVDLICTRSTLKDADRVNMGPKYVYDRRANFRECLAQVQAKNHTVPQAVLNAVEALVAAHGLVDKGNSPFARHQRVTKDHISMFLRDLGYTKHYDDLAYIHYAITRQQPLDLSSLEAKLLEDFDAVLRVHERLQRAQPAPTRRKASLNVQAILHQLLVRHGFVVPSSDLILFERRGAIVQDDTMAAIFAELGWTWNAWKK